MSCKVRVDGWVVRLSGVAASHLELLVVGECKVGGETPELHEVLADVRWQFPAPACHLGPHRAGWDQAAASQDTHPTVADDAEQEGAGEKTHLRK